jgi:hypothetical protein
MAGFVFFFQCFFWACISVKALSALVPLDDRKCPLSDSGEARKMCPCFVQTKLNVDVGHVKRNGGLDEPWK